MNCRVQDELKGSSVCFGYLYILQKLLSSGLTADKKIVRLILKSLDPVGLTKERDENLHVMKIIHLVQIILGILMVMIS